MVNYIAETVSTAVAYVLLCLWGVPVLAVAEPEQMKGYRFITMPVFGLGAATLALYYLFLLEIPVGQSAWFVTGTVILIDILFVFAKRVYISIDDIKRVVIAFFFVLTLSGIYLSPLLIGNDGISSLLHGNGDWANYGAFSEIIKCSEYSRAVVGDSVLVTSIEGQTRGAMFLVAYFSSIFSLSIWESLDMVFLLSFLFMAMAGGVLGNIVGGTWKAGLLTCVLVLFNCGYIYLIEESFLGQISSLPIFMVASAYMLYESSSICTMAQVDRERALAIGFLSASMFITYMEQVPFLGWFLLTILIAAFWEKKEAGIAICKEYLIAAIVVFVLFGRGVVVLIDIVMHTSGVAAGWPVPTGSLLQAVGLYDTYLGTLGAADFFEWPKHVVIGASLVLALALLIYIMKNYNGGTRKKLLLGMLSFGCLHLFFLYAFRSYQSFKALTNIQYYFIVLFGVMCAETFNKTGERIVGVIMRSGAVLLIALVIANGGDFYARWFMRHSHMVGGDGIYNASSQYANSDDDELASFLARENSEYKIMVRQVDVCDSAEAVVAAVEAGVSADRISNADGYGRWNETMELSGSKYLNIESNVMRDPIRTQGRIVFYNDTFLVREIDEKPICRNRGNVGASFRRLDENGFSVVGKEMHGDSFDLVYDVREPSTYDVHFNFESLNNRMVDVLLNGEQKGSINIEPGWNNTYTIKDLSFNSGENVLRFRDSNGELLENLWLLEARLGNVTEDDVNRVKINPLRMPEGIGLLRRFWKKVLLESESKRFVKEFASYTNCPLGIGEANMIADGLMKHDPKISKKLFLMCNNLDIVEHGSNEEYVVFCYKSILEREAAVSEVSGWVMYLERGGSREALFMSFLNSDEFKSKIERWKQEI